MTDILSNVGSLYMVVLILLLIVGLGMLGVELLKYLGQIKFVSANKVNTRNGGSIMQNNGWLRLALFSFIGIVISMIILSFVQPSGMYGSSMTGHAGMQMQPQYGMNMSGMAPMGNMQGSIGMMGAPMNNMQMNDQMMMNQLYQMQMQINQMQQMMGGMGMQGMPSGSMSGGGMGMMGMPMGGMSGGGMGMMGMPMGGSSGSMSSGGGGSMGGMGMM